jgi:hypothetical protein
VEEDTYGALLDQLEAQNHSVVESLGSKGYHLASKGKCYMSVINSFFAHLLLSPLRFFQFLLFLLLPSKDPSKQPLLSSCLGGVADSIGVSFG